MLRAACGRQRPFTLRRLQLHQDCAEALCEVVVNVARQAVALLEDRLAAFLESLLLVDAALVQRERRVPRDRFDQRDAPPRATLGLLGHAEVDPSEILATQNERCDEGRVQPVLAVELAHELRQSRIVAAILDGLFPAFLVVEEELRHREAREVGGPEVRVVEHLAEQVRHPEIAALLVFVDQPHAGGVALALFGQRLQQRAEEGIEVGHAHEQVERVLRDLGLNVGKTFRAPSLLRFARESASQFSRIARVDHALDALVDRACASAVCLLVFAHLEHS